jgi:hypothetical protein
MLPTVVFVALESPDSDRALFSGGQAAQIWLDLRTRLTTSTLEPVRAIQPLSGSLRW